MRKRECDDGKKRNNGENKMREGENRGGLGKIDGEE